MPNVSVVVDEAEEAHRLSPEKKANRGTADHPSDRVLAHLLIWDGIVSQYPLN